MNITIKSVKQVVLLFSALSALNIYSMVKIVARGANHRMACSFLQTRPFFQQKLNGREHTKIPSTDFTRQGVEKYKYAEKEEIRAEIKRVVDMANKRQIGKCSLIQNLLTGGKCAKGTCEKDCLYNFSSQQYDFLVKKYTEQCVGSLSTEEFFVYRTPGEARDMDKRRTSSAFELWEKDDEIRKCVEKRLARFERKAWLLIDEKKPSILEYFLTGPIVSWGQKKHYARYYFFQQQAYLPWDALVGRSKRT